LLYGSENLTIKARDTRKVTAAGKKYIWKKQQNSFEQIIKQTQRLQMN
jgi:hypothetical protein